MGKFLCLLLASGFLMATSASANVEAMVVGDIEYRMPEVDPGFGPIKSINEEIAARTLCPRGWQRIPQHRWSQNRNRWEFSGWSCRRARRP